MKYKRILLKVSGEALANKKGNGIDSNFINDLALMVKELVRNNVEVAVVVGGGNFYRGRDSESIKKETGDYMGMLATLMNSLALKDIFLNNNINTKVLSALDNELTEKYDIEKANKYLNNNVLILACGTGHPYVTTDTAAALRGIEINADAILFGKNIDAVYSEDPKINPNATKYDEITYDEYLNRDLKVIDKEAIELAIKNPIKFIIFGLDNLDNIIKIINGANVGTIIKM